MTENNYSDLLRLIASGATISRVAEAVWIDASSVAVAQTRTTKADEDIIKSPLLPRLHRRCKTTRASIWWLGRFRLTLESLNPSKPCGTVAQDNGIIMTTV